MSKLPELYFKDPASWRNWLEENHNTADGAYLIFYKVGHDKPSMRWEQAVRVALCFGWIDSTVKSLGEGKRRQYFCPRKPKSVWSKVNKEHIALLREEGQLHPAGIAVIQQAKADGSWSSLDDVENGVLPDDLKQAFKNNPGAMDNYRGFSRTYQKGYLYWLNQAKRPATRQARIREIIRLCAANMKSRQQ